MHMALRRLRNIRHNDFCISRAKDNSMTRYLFVFLASLLLSWANPDISAAEEGVLPTLTVGENRVVIQINENDLKKWNTVLGNIRNMRAEFGGRRLAVTVVLIGPGLGMVTAESLSANGVQEAQADGVRFVACGNSMKTQGLVRDDLLDGVEVAAAGYVEIVRLQQQGWSYLRP